MEKEKIELRRDLQPARGKVQEKDVILLRDPLALSAQVLAVGGGGIRILQLLDGTRDLARVRLEAIHMAGGDVAAGDDAQELVELLDERCLLMNGHFREAVQQVLKEWRSVIDRPAAFAGAAYSRDPSELARSIEDVLDHAPDLDVDLPPGRLVAVVAPHIDLSQGWPVYGAAYGLLAQSVPDPERILVLGTGHGMDQGMFCPTTKHYVTPLGTAHTDVDLVAELRQAGHLGDDDLAHRGEHSIEFQVLFLTHLFGDDLAPLVPMLCGDATRHLKDEDRPASLPGAGPLLERLRPSVQDGRMMVVAGVDLAHVGPKFGDQDTSSELLPRALAHETALISAMEDVDPVAFWKEARRIEDGHHVCGLSSLGFLLELLPPGTQGKLLCRDVMRDLETSSAVGFAAVAFFAEQTQ